ncbi:hypothetical protein PAPYR_4712 [Paratrimastix pyriformis]|uniref:F-box domain-containing protein n=1 Tax=Paratrimastix pyriformis TaxID=342808 RepID=A0ABQ8URP7_9EUKA|nr:hypothetical protein PAPYR_4712 [Paratrimastix pyriformis]
MSGAPHIALLLPETITVILSKLPYADVIRVSQVCRLWRDMARPHRMWLCAAAHRNLEAKVRTSSTEYFHLGATGHEHNHCQVFHPELDDLVVSNARATVSSYVFTVGNSAHLYSTGSIRAGQVLDCVQALRGYRQSVELCPSDPSRGEHTPSVATPSAWADPDEITVSNNRSLGLKAVDDAVASCEAEFAGFTDSCAASATPQAPDQPPLFGHPVDHNMIDHRVICELEKPEYAKRSAAWVWKQLHPHAAPGEEPPKGFDPAIAGSFTPDQIHQGLVEEALFEHDLPLPALAPRIRQLLTDPPVGPDGHVALAEPLTRAQYERLLPHFDVIRAIYPNDPPPVARLDPEVLAQAYGPRAARALLRKLHESPPTAAGSPGADPLAPFYTRPPKPAPVPAAAAGPAAAAAGEADDDTSSAASTFEEEEAATDDVTLPAFEPAAPTQGAIPLSLYGRLHWLAMRGSDYGQAHGAGSGLFRTFALMLRDPRMSEFGQHLVAMGAANTLYQAMTYHQDYKSDLTATVTATLLPPRTMISIIHNTVTAVTAVTAIMSITMSITMSIAIIIVTSRSSRITPHLPCPPFFWLEYATVVKQCVLFCYPLFWRRLIGCLDRWQRLKSLVAAKDRALKAAGHRYQALTVQQTRLLAPRGDDSSDSPLKEGELGPMYRVITNSVRSGILPLSDLLCLPPQPATPCDPTTTAPPTTAAEATLHLPLVERSAGGLATDDTPAPPNVPPPTDLPRFLLNALRDEQGENAVLPAQERSDAHMQVWADAELMDDELVERMHLVVLDALDCLQVLMGVATEPLPPQLAAQQREEQAEYAQQCGTFSPDEPWSLRGLPFPADSTRLLDLSLHLLQRRAHTALDAPAPAPAAAVAGLLPPEALAVLEEIVAAFPLPMVSALAIQTHRWMTDALWDLAEVEPDLARCATTAELLAHPRAPHRMWARMQQLFHATMGLSLAARRPSAAPPEFPVRYVEETREIRFPVSPILSRFHPSLAAMAFESLRNEQVSASGRNTRNCSLYELPPLWSSRLGQLTDRGAIEPAPRLPLEADGWQYALQGYQLTALTEGCPSVNEYDRGSPSPSVAFAKYARRMASEVYHRQFFISLPPTPTPPHQAMDFFTLESMIFDPFAASIRGFLRRHPAPLTLTLPMTTTTTTTPTTTTTTAPSASTPAPTPATAAALAESARGCGAPAGAALGAIFRDWLGGHGPVICPDPACPRVDFLDMARGPDQRQLAAALPLVEAVGRSLVAGFWATHTTIGLPGLGVDAPEDVAVDSRIAVSSMRQVGWLHRASLLHLAMRYASPEDARKEDRQPAFPPAPTAIRSAAVLAALQHPMAGENPDAVARDLATRFSRADLRAALADFLRPSVLGGEYMEEKHDSTRLLGPRANPDSWMYLPDLAWTPGCPLGTGCGCGSAEERPRTVPAQAWQDPCFIYRFPLCGALQAGAMTVALVATLPAHIKSELLSGPTNRAARLGGPIFPSVPVVPPAADGNVTPLSAAIRLCQAEPDGGSPTSAARLAITAQISGRLVDELARHMTRVLESQADSLRSGADAARELSALRRFLKADKVRKEAAKAREKAAREASKQRRIAEAKARKEQRDRERQKQQAAVAAMPVVMSSLFEAEEEEGPVAESVVPPEFAAMERQWLREKIPVLEARSKMLTRVTRHPPANQHLRQISNVFWSILGDLAKLTLPTLFELRRRHRIFLGQLHAGLPAASGFTDTDWHHLTMVMRALVATPGARHPDAPERSSRKTEAGPAEEKAQDDELEDGGEEAGERAGAEEEEEEEEEDEEVRLEREGKVEAEQRLKLQVYYYQRDWFNLGELARLYALAQAALRLPPAALSGETVRLVANPSALTVDLAPAEPADGAEETSKPNKDERRAIVPVAHLRMVPQLLCHYLRSVYTPRELDALTRLAEVTIQVGGLQEQNAALHLQIHTIRTQALAMKVASTSAGLEKLSEQLDDLMCCCGTPATIRGWHAVKNLLAVVRP